MPWSHSGQCLDDLFRAPQVRGRGASACFFTVGCWQSQREHTPPLARGMTLRAEQRDELATFQLIKRHLHPYGCPDGDDTISVSPKSAAVLGLALKFPESAEEKSRLADPPIASMLLTAPISGSSSPRKPRSGARWSSSRARKQNNRRGIPGRTFHKFRFANAVALTLVAVMVLTRRVNGLTG